MARRICFIGGSRHVSSLPVPVQEKLRSILRREATILIGDASGADKAVQQFLLDSSHERVTVFCSGERYRNNLGHWPIHSVEAPKNASGYRFYAAKDREMAREADYGFMIWDGKSPGTVMNVLRLVQDGKQAELFNVASNKSITFNSRSDLQSFLSSVDSSILESLRTRATEDEWTVIPQLSLF